MKEIWKDVKGYEGSYQVSSLGRVKLVGGKMIPSSVNKEGYPKNCTLRNEDGIRKSYQVRRLMAFAFLMPIPCKHPRVLTRDEDKSNIALSNLYFQACSKCRAKNEGIKYVKGRINKYLDTIEYFLSLYEDETERVKIQELLTAIKEVLDGNIKTD